MFVLPLYYGFLADRFKFNLFDSVSAKQLISILNVLDFATSMLAHSTEQIEVEIGFN